MAASSSMEKSAIDQNEVVSSSSDDVETNRCLNTGEVSSSDTGGLSRMADDTSIEVLASSTAATESSQNFVPKGAGCVSSTDAPIPAETCDRYHSEDSTKSEKDDASKRKGGQGADSSSSCDQAMKKPELSFKLPDINLSSKKHGQNSSGIHETASTSSGFAVPSSVEGPKKGTIAFALPKSLPKSKHGSFQGSEAAQSKQEEKDKSSDVSKRLDKKSEENEKAAVVNAPPLSYKEPSWSGVPSQEYHLEVLKNGSILSKVALNDKPYHVFGRLASCDFQMDHPSLSRYHMVLQYRPTGDGEHDPGFYVFDLGSTHGSFLNKQQLKAKAFYRMNVGHMFKLGGSTRLFILQVD